MRFILTEQAQIYLTEIEDALLLPHHCKCKHGELQEIITRLKAADSSIKDPGEEICKILRILGKYSYANTTEDISTADTFYELFRKLFNLTKRFKLVEK